MVAHTGSSKCMQPLDFVSELVYSLIDRLDLAVDGRITAVELQSRRRLAEGTRSTPAEQLSTDSPMYNRIVNIASPPVPPAVRMTAKCTEPLDFASELVHSLIDRLD
ncbi:unnamed protein product [Macrosiphum euphorbiae]|uniref:Uncharacterized protein n=1 Tax=Macrosiphum euphorbiae TaxID=13131 RepID=A0AAV0XCQ8_9HEMI|nr:unnamed protein product [Macrosiphum euphorbiae]